jgi:hypothetical protein
VTPTTPVKGWPALSVKAPLNLTNRGTAGAGFGADCASKTNVQHTDSKLAQISWKARFIENSPLLGWDPYSLRGFHYGSRFRLSISQAAKSPMHDRRRWAHVSRMRLSVDAFVFLFDLTAI